MGRNLNNFERALAKHTSEVLWWRYEEDKKYLLAGRWLKYVAALPTIIALAALNPQNVWLSMAAAAAIVVGLGAFVYFQLKMNSHLSAYIKSRLTATESRQI